MTKNIILSVVIPTFGRPDYLPRAIDSALNSSIYPEMVEVIVIPNGPDSQWEKIRYDYEGDSRVKFFYCHIAHGNAARNLGLNKAKGEFIRFLDDDDYLYSEAAKRQLALAISEDLDWISGKIDISDNMNKYGLCSFPESDDLLSAVIPVSGMSLPTGNLIRRNKIKIRWDESINKSQDYVFFIDLAMSNLYKWKKFPEVVGCWFQHNNYRVSDATPGKLVMVNYNAYNKLEIFKSYLIEQGLFNEKIKKEYSKTIWSFVFANYEKDKQKIKLIAKNKKAEGLIYNELYNKSKITKIISIFTNSNPFFLLRLRSFIVFYKKIINIKSKEKNIKKI